MAVFVFLTVVGVLMCLAVALQDPPKPPPEPWWWPDDPQLELHDDTGDDSEGMPA